MAPLVLFDAAASFSDYLSVKRSKDGVKEMNTWKVIVPFDQTLQCFPVQLNSPRSLTVVPLVSRLSYSQLSLVCR